MSSRSKRHLDFEINLIPFIDLLSVCICFLLLTAVWLQVGSLDVKQAIGGQAASDTAKKPTLWAYLSGTGDLQFELKDSRVSAANSKIKLAAKAGRPDLDGLEQVLQKWIAADPGIRTALMHPDKASAFEDMIEIMDRFKKTGIVDLGVSPL